MSRLLPPFTGKVIEVLTDAGHPVSVRAEGADGDGLTMSPTCDSQTIKITYGSRSEHTDLSNSEQVIEECARLLRHAGHPVVQTSTRNGRTLIVSPAPAPEPAPAAPIRYDYTSAGGQGSTRGDRWSRAWW